MKKITSILLFTLILLMSMTVFGQVSGKIVDEMGPMSDVNVMVQGSKQGAVTDFNGKFSIANAKDGVLKISFLGYGTKTIAFKAGQDLGTIVLESTGESMEEIVIIGSGVIDLAKDRKTPIAVTTIKSTQIQEKVGNSDLPELLKSTPSVQSVQRGGFGDGQMYLRGFDQTNTAFLLNGQPINGMEDGKMYWSNWSGVLDIANAIQVQRGLGSSKLAISSVGGTVNIVTKTIDKKEGGFIQTMVGNDNYMKTSAYYSTGLMENGLAVSAMFGHWQGDGYMDGAKGQGQTYFLSFGYKPNENHIFNFLLTGAPQWHGAAGGSSLQTYLDKGRKYSNWWGYYKGKEYAGGRNFYHKPIVNLSWDWKLNDKSTLSTVAYGSLGRGGFAYPEGSSFYSFRDSNGLLDYDAIESNNIFGGGNNFVKASINSHNWFGLISNFEHKLNDNLSFNAGVDGRFYTGIHYRAAASLLGAQPEVTNSYNGTYTITEEIGFNPWDNLFSTVDRNQRYSYDYEENINYIGGFGQLEYKAENYSAYFQGAVSNQSHERTEFWTTTTAEKSEKINNLGYNLKLGGSYDINENNIVFVNAGYYSRQPYHEDLYTNDRKSNEINPFGEDNQEITGLEAGYKFKSEKISANFNVYHTIWDNRILASGEDTNDDFVSDEFTQSSGIKQIHQGVELEVFTRPLTNLKIDGFVSIGNWKYDGNVSTKTFDDDGVLLREGDIAYIDGVKVGNASQFTAGITAKYKVTKNFSLDANYNFNDKLYGTIDLSSSTFTTEDNEGALELPSYGTMDAGLSYKMEVGKDKRNSLNLRLNVNNVFDELYIENATTNRHTTTTSDTWKGIDTSNRVYIGYGTTWNFSMRYKF